MNRNVLNQRFSADRLDYCCRDTWQSFVSKIACFREERDETRRHGRNAKRSKHLRVDSEHFPPGEQPRQRMFEEHCVLQSMRFPQKLWRIVNECQTGAIRWSANGDTVLLDYKKFQTEYLDARRPIFKTSNITSFIRQLNLYGFRKVTSHNRDPVCNSYNPHVHEFLHENFRADRTDLLFKVCRKTGGKSKCLQQEITRSAEEGPRLQTNCVSRLKLCQVYLPNTSYNPKEFLF